MMQRDSIRGIWMAVILTCFIIVNGCSLIGYGIGSAIDNSNENFSNAEKWELGETKKGRKVRVTLRNGEVVKGKYRGLDSLDYFDYSSKCRNSRDQISNSVAFPCPGDSVLIVTNTSDSINGRLLGYDIHYIMDREEGSLSLGYQVLDFYRLSLKSTRDTLPLDLLLTGVKSVMTEDRRIINAGSLQEVAASEELPLRSAVKIRLKWDEHQIPVDEAEKIEVDSAHHTKYYLLAVGLAIDAFCIAIAIALSQMDIGLSFTPTY